MARKMTAETVVPASSMVLVSQGGSRKVLRMATSERATVLHPAVAGTESNFALGVNVNGHQLSCVPQHKEGKVLECVTNDGRILAFQMADGEVIVGALDEGHSYPSVSGVPTGEEELPGVFVKWCC
eukprot:9729875-Ditylum_brightwellii.AAC.1